MFLLRALILINFLIIAGCNPNSVGVYLLTPAASVDKSEISGTDQILADGVATSTISIILKDPNDLPLVGITPTFTATNTDSKNSYGGCSVSDSNGLSTCSLASTKAETKILSITSPVRKNGQSVTFVSGSPNADKSSISGTSNILADGTDTSLITITLRDDFGNPISGQTPTFEASDWEGANIYGGCSVSNASGESFCTLASAEWETKELRITAPVVKTGGSVVFTEVDYCIGAANTNAPFAFGDGSPASPYGICTASQLNNIGNNAIYVTNHFKLFKNIDLSSYTANSFNMIASSGTPFTGTFNGNRKTISNLTYSDAAADYVGLFRSIGGTGLVKHLGLVGFTITGRNYTGMLSGFANGNINNCYAKGIVLGAGNTGGLIGRFWETDSTTIVKDSYTEATVTGTDWVGGLVGWARGTITGSHSISTVSGTTAAIDRVGGLVGVVDSGQILNSYAESTVTGQYLVGVLTGGVVGGVINSYAKGTINCSAWCGGIAGTFQTSSSRKIEKSYADVTINTTGGQVGGITGFGYASSNIENTWAKVTINSTAQYLGAIAGYTEGSITNSYGLPTFIGGAAVERGGLAGASGGTLTLSFWDKELDTTLADSAGSKTTAEMQTASTYADWDAAIWNIQDGAYPTLK